MTARIAALAVALAMTTAVAMHAAAQAPSLTPSDFAWRLALDTPGGAAFYKFDVPAAVYEGAARSDLGDVRVFNGAGAAVPIAFLAPPAAAREAVAPVTLALFPMRVDSSRRDVGDLSIKLRRDAAGTTVDLTTREGAAVPAERLVGYLIEVGELATPPVALTLALPPGNATAQVRVEGSDDLAAWRVLNGGSPVLSLEHAGRRLIRDRVDLGPGPTRYLRLTFTSGTPVPELASVRAAFADRLIDPARQSRKVMGVADKDVPGDYLFDVGAMVPVDYVALDLPEINTVAPAQVFARAESKDEWRQIGAGVFYRLRQGQDASEATSPPLALSTTRARYWKVRVDPKSGGLGATPPTLTALWLPQTIVFAARGEPPFDLAFGSAQAKPVALPVATLVPRFDAKTTPATLAVATVGAAKGPPALAALRQPIDLKRWLLWAALGLATLVLGAMAYTLARQMRATPVPPQRAAPSAPPRDENR